MYTAPSPTRQSLDTTGPRCGIAREFRIYGPDYPNSFASHGLVEIKNSALINSR
jgi:hypothetical protein